MLSAYRPSRNTAPGGTPQKYGKYASVTVITRNPGRDDGLIEVAPLLSRCGGRFADLIAEEADAALVAALRAAETIGRPLGPSPFLDRLAALAGRDPRPGKRGRKPRLAAQAAPRP